MLDEVVTLFERGADGVSLGVMSERLLLTDNVRFRE